MPEWQSDDISCWDCQTIFSSCSDIDITWLWNVRFFSEKWVGLNSPERIEGSSYELVRKICSILHIKHVFSDEITYVNGEFYDLVESVESLDEQGLSTLKALLRCEKERCREKPNGYNGIGHVEKKR